MPYDAAGERRSVDALVAAFLRARARSDALAAPLSDEDWMLQPCVEASPVKWNLAHTTWFFETFLLGPAGVEPVDRRFGYLFNSYYQQIGRMHPRGDRGLLSRPTAEDVRRYRREVDDRVVAHLRRLDEDALADVEAIVDLGCAHEEQHQELLLTDVLYAFSRMPFAPAAYETGDGPARTGEPGPATWSDFEPGSYEVGWHGEGFHFDNEGPRHVVHTTPFALADRPVTNADFLQFVRDDGYRRSELWLADGWDMIRAEGAADPMYWRERDGAIVEFTWFGERPLAPAAPVRHLSYYEADAFANWTGARLPTEFEWERAAAERPIAGRFLGEDGPEPAAPAGEGALADIYGSVWEWTRSAYAPYPGYRAPAGAVGEYNGKFMSNQMVLRGGSQATPQGHVRPTYRNFFPPHARWQLSGLRLARDL